jgi:hypothetical protein
VYEEVLTVMGVSTEKMLTLTQDKRSAGRLNTQGCGVAQVVQHLSNKWEALSSNPSMGSDTQIPFSTEQIFKDEQSGDAQWAVVGKGTQALLAKL